MREKKNNNTTPISKMIFDDTHRTLLEKAPELVIPVINEVFHTNYQMDEPFVQLKNEHVDENRKVITDSCLRLRNREYHIESQSSRDGSLAVRMIEYDFMIALESAARGADGTYEMRFPYSCILYLRNMTDLPDSLEVRIIFPTGKEMLYEVPVVKVQGYTLDEILDKGLVFFIPFYLMRYEKKLKQGKAMEAEYAAEGYAELLAEYNKIYEKLQGKISLWDGVGEKAEYHAALLVELMNRIVEYIFPEGKEKERMVKYMGGQVLELEVDKAWERGMERGIKRGMERGIDRGLDLKGMQVYQNMRKRGMSREEAQALAEISDELVREAEKELIK